MYVIYLCTLTALLNITVKTLATNACKSTTDKYVPNYHHVIYTQITPINPTNCNFSVSKI